MCLRFVFVFSSKLGLLSRRNSDRIAVETNKNSTYVISLINVDFSVYFINLTFRLNEYKWSLLL